MTWEAIQPGLAAGKIYRTELFGKGERRIHKGSRFELADTTCTTWEEASVDMTSTGPKTDTTRAYSV